MKEAYSLDIIANTLETLYNSNKSTLFFDELSNIDIEPETGVKILDIADKLKLLK